jgi:hypothetical protein
MPIWDLAIQLSHSLAYAVFAAMAYPVLTINGVTLLSLTYRFFAVPNEGTPIAPSEAEHPARWAAHCWLQRPWKSPLFLAKSPQIDT